MDTRVVTAHLPVDLADKLDGYARSMDRSKGWIVKQALANWVAWEEKKLEMTLEGLSDVEAGRVVPHEEVVRWIESLETDNPLPVPQSGR